MKGKIKSTCWFFLKAILVAFVAIIFYNVPETAIEIWKYMTTADLGFMWVINLIIGATSSYIIFKIYSKSDSIVRNILTIATFIVVVFACETLIWHAKDIWQIATIRVSKEMLKYIFIGICLSTIAFAISPMKREKKEK